MLEVCAGNLASVEAAVQGGAERIELCSALSLDGLTPSMGMVQHVRERFPGLKVHVLIRLREGNFVYNDHEVDVMARDIEAVLPWADGIVCGALTADGHIDLQIARYALDKLNIDKRGLDAIDNKILRTIISTFKGGPVGANTLATAIGEDQGTYEEVYEPFLIKEGFIVRTQRGRVATELSYHHLGLDPYQNNASGSLF